MNINSTEFQQNVGLYLKLAEQGEVVNISKSKPTQSRYQLKVVKAKKISAHQKRLENFFKKVEAHDHDFDFYGNDAVQHVRRIRG